MRSLRISVVMFGFVVCCFILAFLAHLYYPQTKAMSRCVKLCDLTYDAARGMISKPSDSICSALCNKERLEDGDKVFKERYGQ